MTVGESRLISVVVVGLAVALINCSTRRIYNSEAAMTAPPGRIQVAFERLVGVGDHEFVECDHGEHVGGIVEISIEESPCYGFCSTYTMTVHIDGRVSYYGAANVERLGVHQGRVPPEQFRYLAALAEEIGYFDLLSDYSCAVTDNPTVFTSVRRREELKIIRHYAPSHTGPARLRAFEEAVARLYAWIEWEN